MGLPPNLITGVTARGIPGKADDYRVQTQARTAQLRASGMNKTEAAYALELEVLKRAGKIHDYRYGSIKFRMADRTWFTPDFVVWHTPGGLTECVEVKGFWRDDARVKFKVTAEQYPMFAWTAVRRVGKAGWDVERIARRAV